MTSLSSEHIFASHHPTFHVSINMTQYPPAQMICPSKIYQHRKTLNFPKIAIMIATHACCIETSQAKIDLGTSCCVTPHIEDLINQPTPIQNTTLKGIEGGLMALGRGTIQLKIQQENQERIIMIIDNIIYTPDCPIRIISPQQLHRQSRARGYDNSCFTTDDTTATLYHGGDTLKCEYHPRTKTPTISCLPANTAPTQQITSTSMAQQPNHKGRKRVIFHKTQQITTPAAYNSDLNTAQQELLRLHETYAHADMKEIQQQIKNCDLKANRQVAT
jgi:hypothetical protein